MISEPLAHRQNISFGVLEPGGFRTACGSDAVLHLHPRNVIFLEDHASSLELRDLSLNVVDLPKRLAGSGGAGIRSWAHETRRAPSKLIDHPARVFFLRLEFECRFIKFPRTSNIFCGYIDINRCDF